jgi:UDP-glucuronate 4-epimerase
MDVIVTGAAGFIGSQVAREYASLGAKVTCIDNFNNYYSVELKRTRVEQLLEHQNIDFVEMDLANKDQVDQLISSRRPELIVHLAAQAGVRLPISESDKYVSSNLVGFSNILKSTVQYGVPDFMYASSSSVYGNSPHVPYKESEVGLEPVSFYGATKLSNEILAAGLSHNSKTSTRGLRFFTVYGPWGRPDMAYFRMVSSLLLGRDFHLYGDGSLKRDFTYIDDAVEAVISLGQQMKAQNFSNSDLVNVGGGNDYSIQELISFVNNLSSAQLNVIQGSAFDGDVKQTLADSSLLHQLTGKIPSTKLPGGIAKVFDWTNQLDVLTMIKNWD